MIIGTNNRKINLKRSEFHHIQKIGKISKTFLEKKHEKATTDKKKLNYLHSF